MADRDYQVSLSFTANAEKAKREIQQLQNDLKKLSMTAPKGAALTLSTGLVDAQKAAAQLEVSLKRATNVDTGKLNLTSFSTELQKSGKTLNWYKNRLIELGPEGQKAFSNLTRSIMQADVQLKSTNKLVDSLWGSLKRAAEWQISSAILRGFSGSIREAFNYAQDLNESLNRIQIVTGNSTEQMAKFAVQANKAAKELSTTTVEYSDAALIYYQQGLDDQSVKARADLTIKAANAAGTGAQEMSEYLTAVWNSYKVGTDEMEKYVDIMAAIGAGTATSLEEISTAMEKVASVGEATGVTFDRLSSIIATVSSTTRQSAETVGTAFKTIFARMADLKLDGSIEEDGVTTTLGDVSGQLEQIGVHVLDEKGNLRDMGIVLEEVMDKWNGMNEATQQAVAIAMAGKRQYTDLLALMNNQDKYREAMGLAANSAGTTEQQNEVYQKGWEASQKRLKAAAEGLYDSLINDDFFIDFNDNLAKALGLVEDLTDRMGGMYGVIGLIGTALTGIFSGKISAGISSGMESLFSNTEVGRAQAAQLKEEAYQSVLNMAMEIGKLEQDDLHIQELKLKVQKDMVAMNGKMTEEQREFLRIQLDSLEHSERQVAELQEQINARSQGNVFTAARGAIKDKAARREFEGQFNIASELGGISSFVKEQLGSKSLSNIKVNDSNLKQLEKTFNAIDSSSLQANSSVQKVISALKEASVSKSDEAFKKVSKALQDMEKDGQNARSVVSNILRHTDLGGEQIGNIFREIYANAEDLKKILTELGVSKERVKEIMSGYNQKESSFDKIGKSATSALSGVSQLAFGLSSFKGLVDTLSNDDLSFFDKMTQSMMSLSFIIPSLTNGLGQLIQARKALEGVQVGRFLKEEIALRLANLGAVEGEIKAEEIRIAFKEKGIKATLSEIAATRLSTTVDNLKTKSLAGQTVGTKILTAATLILNGELAAGMAILWPYILVIGALTIAAIGLAKAFAYVKNNTPEAKLEKSKKEAEELGKALERAKERTNEFNESLNKLQEAKNKINDLTEGTDEYADAVKNANDQVLDLLSNNKALKLEIDKNGNPVKDDKGVLQLDQESIENYKTDLKANEEALARGKALKDIQVQQQQLDVLKKEFMQSSSPKNQEELIEKLALAREQYYKANPDKQKEWENGTPIEQEKIGLEIRDYMYSLDFSLYRMLEYYKAGQLDKIPNELIPKIQDILQTTESIEALEKATKDNRVNELVNGWGLNKEAAEAVLKATQDSVNSNGIFEAAKKEGLEETDLRLAKESYARANNYTFKDGKFFDEEGKDISEEISDGIVEGFVQAKIEEVGARKSATNFLSEDLGISPEVLSSLTDSQIKGLSRSKDSIQSLQDVLHLDASVLAQNLDQLSKLDSFFSSGGNLDQAAELFYKLNESTKVTEGSLSEFVELLISGDLGLQNIANSLDSTFETLVKGGELSEESAKKLETLEKIFPDLLDSSQRFSYQYIKNLAEVKEYIQNAQFEKALKDKELKIDLTTFDATKEKIEDLDKLIDQERTIDILIKSNLDSELESIKAQSDAIGECYTLLQNGGQLTIEQFDALTTKFPELAEAAKVLADGTIQMELDTAQAILGTEQQSVTAHAESLALRFDQDAEYHQGQSQLYTQLAEAYQDYLNGNADALNQAKTIEGDIVRASEEYQSNLSNEKTSQVTGNEKDVATQTTNAAKDSASNWAAASNSMQESIQKWATYTIQSANKVADAMKNSAEGKTSSVDVGPIFGANGTIEATTLTKKLDKSTFSSNVTNKTSTVLTNAKTQNDIANAQKQAEIEQRLADQAKANAIKLRAMGNTIQNQSNNIGTDPKSGNSSGGGKGSGSDKQQTPQKTEKVDWSKDMSELEDEIERYQDINGLIEEQDHLLKGLSRTKDDAYGKNKVKAVEDYTKALQKQYDLEEKKGKEIQEYLEYDKKNLLDLGLNFEFEDGGEGRITNSREVIESVVESTNSMIKEAEDELNAAAAEYDATVNSGGDKDAAKERYDAAKKAAEEKKQYAKDYLKKVQDGIKQYEDDINELYDSEEKREELLAEIRAENFSSWEYQFDEIKDLTDREIKQLESKIHQLRTDTLQGASQALSYQMQEVGPMLENFQNIGDRFNQLQKDFDNNRISATDYAEGLKKVQDEALDASDALYDLNETIMEQYSDAIDLALEQTEKLIDRFDHLTSLTESYENILGLLGRSTDYKALDKIYGARSEIAQQQVNSAKAYWDQNKRVLDQAQADYDKNRGTAQESYYKNILDKAIESTNNAQEKYFSSVEAFGEAIQQVYMNALAKAGKQLEDELTNGLGWDSITEQMESLQAKDELYLTDTNKKYETQKLIRKANLEMENTSNELAKKRLDLFAKETKQLQKKGQLSKYELEEQQAKYDLLLAQIALEDAQNNKSQVRLQRDSEGNFNYVYTADSDAVSEAQQNYEDAENKLYNIRLEGVNNFAESYISTMQEMNDKLKEIAEDQELDERERRIRMAEVEEDYRGRLIDLQKLYNVASIGLGDDLNQAWGVQVMTNVASTGEAKAAMTNYTDECKTAYREWAKESDTLNQAIQEDIRSTTSEAEKLSTQVIKTVQDGDTAMEAMRAETEAWSMKMNNYLSVVSASYQGIAQSAYDALKAASMFDSNVNWMELWENADNDAAADYFMKIREALLQVRPELAEKWGYNPEALMYERRNEKQNIMSATDLEEIVRLGMLRDNKLKWISEADRVKYSDEITADIVDARLKELGFSSLSELINSTSLDKELYQNIKLLLMNAGRFATGGYTGSWGSEGKLAILDQKELVLNAKDTENILDTVDIMRQLVSNVAYQGLSAIDTIGGKITSMPNGDTLEQEVHIEASFPSVNSKREIEEAFSDLVNIASQYANRKSH